VGGRYRGFNCPVYPDLGMELHGSADPPSSSSRPHSILDRQQWAQVCVALSKLLRPLLEEEGRDASLSPRLRHHSLESYSQAEVTLACRRLPSRGDIQQFCDDGQDFTRELGGPGYGKAAGKGWDPR